MSGIIMWSDFKRFNETYFWSEQRNVFIKPEIENSTGLRICLLLLHLKMDYFLDEIKNSSIF